MTPTKATERSPADKFVDAIPHLEDLTTIHTDPNIASLRANMMRGGNNGAVSDDMVRALEVLGIANAVDARFCSTPQHHAHATKAAIKAGIFYWDVCEWFSNRDAAAGVSASTPTLGEGHDGYRTFLLTHLDWVHKDTSADTSTCLCPVMVYLQLILRYTPMEDWAAAATATDPDASPMAFAWALARKSPGIGRRTADVAVLVTMERHVHRLMANEPARVRRRREAAATNSEILFNEGCWAALGGVVKDCLTGAAKWLRASPSDLDNYERWLESGDAEELRAIVRNAADRLGEAGERYAQLLGEKDVAQEREGVVDSIRSWVGFILSKAEPPAPEKVLLAISGLATAGQQTLG